MTKTITSHKTRITVNDMWRIHDTRIQDELKITNTILKQNPGVSRDDALRAAARIVSTDYTNGKAPA